MVDAPINGVEGAWSAADSGDTLTLADALAFLRRQFWLIVGVVAAMALLALLYILLTPSEYVARAALLIEPGKQQALWQERGIVELTVDSAQVESQVEVLRSERIANDVIAKLGLINDPEFHASGTEYERQRAAVAQFERSLSARRVGQSYVIEVSFRSRDAAKAAQITNAITAAYLRDQQQAKQDVAEQASQWMEAQIADLGVKLNTAAAAVQEFRVSHGITDTVGANNQSQLIDKLTRLEATAQAYRKVFEGLVERFTEGQEQASYPVSNARVISSAARPLVKTYPRSKLVLLLSVLVGLIAGIAAAGARSMLDGSVRGARQIRQFLGLSVLGLLPRLRSATLAEKRIEVLDAPLSPFSDAMHDLKISLRHACGGRSGYSLGLLSLLPEEPTAIVAANLAALFEASGAKTVLVDADLRDRRLSQRLAPDAAVGLAEALRGVPGTIIYERHTKAHLLPVGADSPILDAADLFDSPALPALLMRLKEEFCTILVDLPALRRTGAARAAAPLLDGCILVCTYGRTSLRALEHAVDLLRTDNVALFGVIVAGMSENIPPLFGLHLDEVRHLDYPGLARRLARYVHQRLARKAS